MTPERWRQIEALFDECLELDLEARRLLLEKRCGQDVELRREVEVLLEHAESADRLERIVERSRHSTLAESPVPGRHAGQVVGPYRLEQCLGVGGMGSVWRARRADEEFEHEVAIKFVGPAARPSVFEQRFRTERQILAGLEHPHIARLLDGGSTVDGEPYLVMELVEGQDLVTHADHCSLGVDARLRLFLQVASAVEHAHRHLVVHRDLKPANILVHPETGPKLLDFGIAKLLRNDDAADAANVTRADDRMLTPDYASPEQIVGDPVTTASDVYSLGVVLCELLTGGKPRRLQKLTPAERERALTDKSPERPSALVEDDPSASRRGLDAASLRRRLRGDLDTIVLRALDVEPSRRYGGVSELAADVSRHLRGEPVLARPNTWTYRVSKLVRRHPWGCASSATIVVLVAALLVGLAQHSRRVGTERDRALAAQAEARTVSDFLMHLFEVSDPGRSRGETVTARELLERGGKLIENDLAGQPVAQAALLSTLGEVHLSLGLFERAETLHRLALERRTEHLGAEHAATAASHDRLGDTLREASRLEEAETHLRRALEIRRFQDAAGLEFAESLNNLGLLLKERGDFVSAEPLLRRGLEIRRQELGADDPLTAVSLSNLGQLLMDDGRLGAASPLLEAVVEARLRRLGDRHPKTALALHTLGSLRYLEGQLSDAETLLRRAVDIRRAVLPPRHPHTGATLNTLASLLHDQMRLGDAESLYREALEMELSAGPATLGAAFTLNNLGSLLEDLGRYGEAEPLYRRSMEVRLQNLGVGGSSERIRSKLGLLILKTGRIDEAEEHLIAADDWYRSHRELAAKEWLVHTGRLAVLRRTQGDTSASAALLREALDAAAEIYGPGHQIHIELHAELARTLATSRSPERCRTTLDAVQPITANVDALVGGRFDLAEGLCFQALGRGPEASAALRSALDRLRPVYGEKNHWVRSAEEALAVLGPEPR